ncbi:MAG: hypothetical protein IJI56_04850 [Firmicutes bacterium]|nr:hypothetical protein [Bacillota bacterium]MBR0481206.1 hypothetical protein [Bacillota bacterium]
MGGCGAKESTSEEEKQPSGPASAAEEDEEMKMYIGEREVSVIWEENASVEELKSLCPLKIDMSMYGGFEQIGSIGKSIARDDRQMTTESGDVVLYSGSQIVVFYGSNSWSYTRLGHVDLPEEEMAELLGNGDVVLSLE